MTSSQLIPAGVLTLSMPLLAQHTDSDLRVLFNPREYAEPVHSADPSPASSYLFLAGEKVGLYVRVANQTSQLLSLLASGVAPDLAVRVRLMQRVGDTWTQIPGGFVSEGSPVLLGNSQSYADQWADRIILPPRWSVSIPGYVATDVPLSPGAYELQMVSAAVACEPACSVRNHAGIFRFEVRSADALPEQLDQLFRRALVSIDHSKFEEADAAIETMLKLHPSSSAAHQLRGRKAEQLGNWVEAASAYERAVDILQFGRDRVRRSSSEPGSTVAFLKSRAAEAKAKRDK